jgi:hypothetical protein
MVKTDWSPTPPASWIQIVILWNDVFYGPQYPIREILNWVDKYPGGQYFLQGCNSTDGFDFRFERAEDATFFKLLWL